MDSSRAENVDEVMGKARICLSPLRFGAGLKGKFIDAMNNGTPIVTTEMGAEGMTFNNKWPGYISDNAEEIANKAVSLYLDQDQWEQFQKIGFDLINDHFSNEKYGQVFIDRLTNIQQNLESYREKNTVGLLLTHHQLQSTKYMAKWIEVKNSRK